MTLKGIGLTVIKVNKGESFLDDRYYFSDKLTKRVLAQDGRPIAEWILKYEDNRINRFSLRDTTKFEERVYLYDDNNLPLKTIIYVNGDYHAEELYEYDNEKKLKTLYRLGTLKDTVAKTSFERRSEQLIKKLDYKKNEAAALVLVESTDYNYRSLSNKRESSNTLYYSSKGICVMSRTKKFDNEGSLVSAEDINLINGDWSMVRSFYFTIDDGAIVMGE
jgi:antitoxin component YwqK of YwqJK toxin-antitoxin module